MKRALIIIDMQNGFMNEHTEHLVDKIKNYYLKHHKDFNMIIGTEYINHTGTACYQFEGYKSCMEGTVESYTVPKLKSIMDIIIKKDVYSCYSSYLRGILSINGIEEVYLCGVNTGCCVLHSAFDLYNGLIPCKVIEDLCGSTSGHDSHKVAIQVLKECITKDRVITSEDNI